MRKTFWIYLAGMIVLAAVLAGCGKGGAPTAAGFPTMTPAPPTATSVPPTATAVPPTATPVPPTATAVPTAAPTKASWSLTDVKTWDLKPYPEGKEPEPQNRKIVNDDGSFPKAFYIGNPEVRAYFIELAKQSLFEMFGPGQGKVVVGTDAGFNEFRKKYAIPGSPSDRGLVSMRKKAQELGVYEENAPSPLSPDYAYFWETWLIYDQTTKTYKVVTRWVRKAGCHDLFYRLSDDSLEHKSLLSQPVEGFILWRVDKENAWRQWGMYQGWLRSGLQPGPSVYDPSP